MDGPPKPEGLYYPLTLTWSFTITDKKCILSYMQHKMMILLVINIVTNGGKQVFFI